jgi:hypothetical protein
MVFENFRAKRELNNIQLNLEKLKKPSIKLPETYVDIPEEYYYPHINLNNKEVVDDSQQELKTLQASNKVYVKLSEDKRSVHFVYVVFKGTYYIVLQVGINTTDPKLVIVSIKNFKKDEVLTVLETNYEVKDTLTLYEARDANELNYNNINAIIMMLLKKYPSVGELNPNDEFFTEDNTISRAEAYNSQSMSIKDPKNVVKLCIYNSGLYLCIGIHETGWNGNPSYDLYLYTLKGEKYQDTITFQRIGFRNEQFTALTEGTKSDVFKVNNMDFYDLNKALKSVSPASTSSVGSHHISRNTTVPTEARSEFKKDGGNTNETSWLNNPRVLSMSRPFDDMGDESWGNRGGSCRRKTKRKYKRNRTSKINKKARKTHTRRIRR